MRHEQRKIERILNMNYTRSHLTEGEEWYLGNGEFLTLRETKKHLLEKMNIIKVVLRTAQNFCTDFNNLINEAEISGHLYEDTFELADILSILRQLSEDFFVVFQEFENQEFNMRMRCFTDHDEEELPF